MKQQALFPVPSAPSVEGFLYMAHAISEAEEAALLQAIYDLPFAPYLHEGYAAKRKVCRFTKESGYPDFLDVALERAASFAGIATGEIVHALVTEYAPGTQIGWHRDQPPYDKVIGISLRSDAPFRFRRERDAGFERVTITAERRSIYLMGGPARYIWQHSIPPVRDWRYSITMRTA